MKIVCHSVLFSGGSLSSLLIWTFVALDYFSVLVFYYLPLCFFFFMLYVSDLDLFWVVIIKFMKKKFHIYSSHFLHHDSYLHSPLQFHTFTLPLAYALIWYLCCNSKLYFSSFYFLMCFIFLPCMLCLSFQWPLLCGIAIPSFCLSICNVACGSAFFSFIFLQLK